MNLIKTFIKSKKTFNKQKKYLTVSSNPKYWARMQKVLLAGKWCLDPNKKFSNKAKINLMKNNFFEISSAEKEADYCNNLYEQLLKELTISLNNFHKINWSLKSWRIMIGPWLNRYVAVINNRVNILQQAKKDYAVYFKDITFKNNSLISQNIVDFSNKSVSDEWNEKLIRRIDQIYKKEKNISYINNLDIEIFETKKEPLINKIINFFGYKMNYLINKFLIKKNYFFFHKIYIGDFFTILKLFLSLKQIPVNLFFSKKIPNYQFNLEKRRYLKFEKNNISNEKEKIIRFFLLEMIPILYIEGFSNLRKLIELHNLPRKKINIFTCNAWNDTIFKFWLSDTINLGSKLIYGQHGSGYGLIKKHLGDIHDRAISDNFISWGQKYKKNKNNIPGIVQSIIRKKKEIPKIINKKIIIIPTVNDIYLYRNEVKDPNFLIDDLYIISNFVNNIYRVFKNNLLLKIHPLEYKKSFSYFNYFKIKNKNLKIITNEENLESLMIKSRLCIFLYLGTDFLKNLSISRPSIAVLPKQIVNTLTPEAIKIIKKLNKVNVVFFNFEAAEEFIIKNYNNISDWWLDKFTQSEIKKFTNVFARNPEDSLTQLAKMLSRCR